MKRVPPILLILIAGCCALFGAAERAMRFDDLMAVGRLTAPALSPDGKWIAFAVQTPDVAANKLFGQIYLLATSGGAPQKLDLGKGSHSQPAFTVEALTFLSVQDGVGRIRSIDLRKLPSFDVKTTAEIPGGFDNFTWIAGGRILFSKAVFPQAASLAESVQKEAEAEKSPVKARLLTTLPFRIFNQWKNDQYSHVFLLDPAEAGGVARDLTPGAYDTPPIDLGGPQDFGISGDGRWFAYVKNLDPLVAISTNNDVFLRELATGREENLTRANPGNDAGPLFSPRSRFLAYLSMKRAQFEADKRDIILHDLAKKTSVNLTEAFTDTISDYVFSPDEKWIYFLAPRGLYQPIFRLEIRNRKIEELVSGVTASGLAVTPDGRELVFLSQSATRPNELFKFHVGMKRKTQLTRINDPLFAEIRTMPAETFRFPGARGETIEGVLVKPPFFDPQKKYPLVYIVHGGPQGAWGDEFHFRWNMAMFAAPGYVVAGINFHGSTGYGQAFTDSISRDWGGAPFADVVAGQQYLVEQFPWIDRERIVAAGASYGGFMINWMAGHIDQFKYPFRALISHASIFDARSMYYSTEELWFDEWEHGGPPWKSDLYEKWNPANFVTRFSVPTLVVHGEQDFRVPISQGFMLFTALQRLGVESKMLYFPDEGHFVAKPQNARLWWQTVLDWIAGHIR